MHTARFPAVQNYINETISECRLKGKHAEVSLAQNFTSFHVPFMVPAGYLSTIGQRRRWFPQITSPQPNVKSRAERQAVNFPVQGKVPWRSCVAISCTRGEGLARRPN